MLVALSFKNDADVDKCLNNIRKDFYELKTGKVLPFGCRIESKDKNPFNLMTSNYKIVFDDDDNKHKQ
jgi:hypothetical protein